MARHSFYSTPPEMVGHARPAGIFIYGNRLSSCSYQFPIEQLLKALHTNCGSVLGCEKTGA